MAKRLESRIELNLDDGFDKETLSKLKKGVIGLKEEIKFLIEEYSNQNKVGFLLKRVKGEACKARFKIEKIGENGYRLLETDIYEGDKGYGTKLENFRL